MLYKYCDTKGFSILLESRLSSKGLRTSTIHLSWFLELMQIQLRGNITKEFEENPNIINAWKGVLTDQNINYDHNLRKIYCRSL